MLPIRKEVVAFLRGLDDEGLAEVISEAMASRNSRLNGPNGDFSSTVYTLAKVLHSPGETEAYVVGTARHPENLGAAGERPQHAHEQGRCRSCQVLLVSTAKLATCPVCGAEVECT